MTMPADNAARHAALTIFDRTLLVEAGAGSGKTAIMAGRVAMMLLEGTAPRHVVAITFTEAAAGELLTRIRDFLDRLAQGIIPVELEVALPDGLNTRQFSNLENAANHIDELTVGTIHSFSQQLIRPYPVEAATDPGASIMDSVEADLQLNEVIDRWLSSQLDTPDDGFLPELVWSDPAQALELVRTIVRQRHKNRGLRAPPVTDARNALGAFRSAALSFHQHADDSHIQVPEVMAVATELMDAARVMEIDASLPEAPQLVKMLTLELGSSVVTQTGQFRSFRHKGRFRTQAAEVGQSQMAANSAHDAATDRYEHCRITWESARSAVASIVLNGLIAEVSTVTDAFQDAKRMTAQLDFDDLLYTACALLRNSETVRLALAQRYQHVLVDEFQDTDPLQAEILWRLCGEADGSSDDWRSRRIRPGALFLVGDPKQAIYRFRGADVNTYLHARDSLAAQDPDCILTISTNFRSQPGILDFANRIFREHLSADGQPGFSALTAFFDSEPELPQVVRLPVDLPAGQKPNVGTGRKAESQAVAALCSQLIGDHQVRDRNTGELRACRPGDIALLAPVGRDLYMYEAELENRGIPIATQAGKGLYRRQEIQDMIALTRLLADSRDRLALGSFLRGPLVGLTDEQLLDIIEQQPVNESFPDALPRLSLDLEPAFIQNAYAREIIEQLRSLYRRANYTTPYDLLSQAVELLNIRPLLSGRHQRRAERALANLDTYLELMQSYDVRGLRAAAHDMTNAWQDETRAVEGRTDAAEDAVSIVTMHSAKGLEWPIVIPVNALGAPNSLTGVFGSHSDGILYCPVFRVRPAGYDEAARQEELERNRERTRLWYVALTRARDMLVIPDTPAGSRTSSWADNVGLEQHALELPPLTGEQYSPSFGLRRDEQRNDQTRELFQRQAETIAANKRSVTWLAPSRDEQPSPLEQELDREFRLVEAEDDQLFIEVLPPTQGGHHRGLVLHKLAEEILTGELSETGPGLRDRAAELIRELGREVVSDATIGLSPDELAECVTRTFALPQIKELRDQLLPEYPVGFADLTAGGEQVVTGVSDAVAYDPAGTPVAVVDWKSDVSPSPDAVKHYRAQLSTYMRATGASRGLIVFMTSGTCVEIRSQDSRILSS